MSARAGTVSMIVTVLAMLALAPVLLVAQTSASRFSISGTSTVRSWTCTAEGVMEIEPGSSSEAVPGFPSGVESVAMVISVGTIECPEEEMMEHLQEAMDEPEYPEITYRLEQYTFKSDDTAEATGTMTIHGTTKSITFDIQLVQSAEGTRGLGETSIAMTEYGVEPPSVWLGMLNVGEVVSIKFDALLPASR